MVDESNPYASTDVAEPPPIVPMRPLQRRPRSRWPKRLLRWTVGTFLCWMVSCILIGIGLSVVGFPHALASGWAPSLHWALVLGSFFVAVRITHARENAGG